MTSPQIKVLVSLAGASILYAFFMDIQISRKARKLANWIQHERPDLWATLNLVARTWNGGYPGLKILYRKNVVGLSTFDQEFKLIHGIEQKFLGGIGIGLVCLGVLFIGIRFWGWHW